MKIMNSISQPEYTPVKVTKKQIGGALLIDVSSWIFWILFSLRNKYLHTRKHYPEFKYSLSDYIMANVHTAMHRSIERFQETHQTSLLVMARDSCRETIWRLKRYDRYKTQRRNFTRHRGEDIDFSQIFQEIYAKVYERVVEEKGAISLKVETTEADDIIAIVTKELVSKNQMRVIIIADDNDYFQLLELPKVEAYNLSGISLRDILHGVSPRDYLRSKILKGDRSDNIPACKSIQNLSPLKLKTLSLWEARTLIKIGMLRTKFMNPEEVCELQSNPRLIRKKMEQDPIFREDYVRNARLIDMHYIPHEITAKIIETWNIKYETNH